MKSNKILYLLALTFLSGIVFIACSKDKERDDYLTIPPAQAHFANKTTGRFQVSSTNQTYKIAVGVTNVENRDRVVNFSVSSNSGAVAGTHYTIAQTSVTIPAGKTTDTIVLTANPALYPLGGRRDTLNFTILEPSVTPSTYNKSFRLVLSGPCQENVIDLQEFVGEYNGSTEDYLGTVSGPYTINVLSAVQTSPTSGILTINNIRDGEWQDPIKITLDWSNPSVRTVTAIENPAIAGTNAGSVYGATYNGRTLSARQYAGSPGTALGTFSICNQTISVDLQLGITAVGWGNGWLTLFLAR